MVSAAPFGRLAPGESARKNYRARMLAADLAALVRLLFLGGGALDEAVLEHGKMPRVQIRGENYKAPVCENSVDRSRFREIVGELMNL